jgi:hypothetical protein
MRISRAIKSCWVCLVVWVGLSVAAPVGSADYDPVGSGTAKIMFDKGFVSFLKDNRIQIKASAPARVSGRNVVLPAIAGSMEPTLGKGRVDTDGALVLMNARNRVPFSDVSIRTKAAPWVAKVGGSQLKVATSSQLEARRKGFGSVYIAKRLSISSKVAVRLNKKLRPPEPFSAGQIVGSLSTQANPQTVTVLPTGRVGLDLDPGFAAKLSSVFVTVTPIFPAERSGSALTLPIIGGGTLAPTGALGTLKTGGDIEFLQLHSSAQVFMHEFWMDFGARTDSSEIDLRPSPPFQGKLGRIPTFGLQPGTVTTDPAQRTITMVGNLLILPPDIAYSLNEAFAEGDDLFMGGETVGSVDFTAHGQ